MSGDFGEISVVLADDHEMMRDGIKVALRKMKHIKLIGEASNGKELCQLVNELQPDVVITDIKMPGIDGIEATRIIKRRFPNTRIIALSILDEQALILEMLDAGANGYLIKNTSKNELQEAIRAVSQGKNYYCPTTSQMLSSYINLKEKIHRQQLPDLTPRELDVMRLLAKGYSNKEIGSALSISPRTIENYRQSIQKKCGCRNAVEISMYALKYGFVELN